MGMNETLKRIRRVVPKQLLGAIAYRLPTQQTTFSQFAEDLLLSKLVPASGGFYVDIGAFHPKFGSNTYRLWKQGWRGMNVDVDDYKIAQFRQFRPRDINLTLGVSSEDTERTFYFQEGESYGSMSSFEKEFADDRGERNGRQVSSRTVPVYKLNTLLQQHLPRDEDGQPASIHLMSIDVEGHEYEILRAFDFDRYRPACLCVEIHAEGFSDLVDKPTYQLLEQNGYQLRSWPAPSCIFTTACARQSHEQTVQACAELSEAS